MTITRLGNYNNIYNSVRKYIKGMKLFWSGRKIKLSLYIIFLWCIINFSFDYYNKIKCKCKSYIIN